MFCLSRGMELQCSSESSEIQVCGIPHLTLQEKWGGMLTELDVTMTQALEMGGRLCVWAGLSEHGDSVLGKLGLTPMFFSLPCLRVWPWGVALSCHHSRWKYKAIHSIPVVHLNWSITTNPRDWAKTSYKVCQIFSTLLVHIQELVKQNNFYPPSWPHTPSSFPVYHTKVGLKQVE